MNGHRNTSSPAAKQEPRPWRYVLPAAGLLLVLPLLLARGQSPAPQSAESQPAVEPRFAVEVHHPPGLGVVQTDRRDALGRTVGVSCGTCHSLFEARPMLRAMEQLTEFHTGMRMEHGKLACAACHHPDDRSRLRLASGQAIEMREAQRLCAQCHGPQHRDYLHGSHGGMSGYWDLRRGPRLRNHCLDCHDPHAPAWGQFQPAPPPRDATAH